METELLLQRLDLFLSGKSGDIQISANDLKRVLIKIKGLECALADVLRLAHARGKLAA